MTQDVSGRGIEQEVRRTAPEEKPALGAPHDAYASTLLTVSLTGFFALLQPAMDAPWLMVPWVGAVAVVLASVHYLKRAHRPVRAKSAARQDLRNQTMPLAVAPMIAVAFAVHQLNWLVLEPLHDEYGTGWQWAFACLVLATLIVAPIQAATSLNPRAREYMTR
ncbi:hypothetical protein [Nesterenkonia sp. F]|uniref:hypothetical protein n=1 Tax=Nesterenkonia sp. F TaxID=795955 RepID=UPI000255D971|nr:hypothetical protein [Nesterenkonia sp. F]